IFIAAVLGILLIMIYPSVINLWYVIGSVMIPGLLIPILGVYIPLFSLKRNWVLPTMAAGIGTSLVWLIAGTLTRDEFYSYTFLGLEPFYPGLFVSILFWFFGRATDEEAAKTPKHEKEMRDE